MTGLERILLMAVIAISFVILALGGCFIVILLEPPPTERLWRTSLEASHGLERVGLIWAYRILHRKQNIKRKKKTHGTKKSARREVADGEGLSASGSASMDSPDSGLREHQQKLRDDANHYELFRGNSESEHEHSEGFQGSTGRNAAPEKPTPSSRPANEHRENRSSSSAGSSEDLSDASGNGGRAGGMIDDFDSPFWKKLVTHAEELGL